MRLIFSIVYTLNFGIHAYYTQADHLTGDPLELWGKIWFISMDITTAFIAIMLWFGWNDIAIRKAAFFAGIYHTGRVVFDFCWLNNIARPDSQWWTLGFFILIFILNLMLINNGRIFKR